MDLFTYLMAKKGKNTYRDLFSYLLGKNAGGGGTYTTFTGISLNISNSVFGAIKNFTLNPTQLTQDGTPSPSTPVEVNTIKGNNNINITNEDSSEEQNYPISLSSKNILNVTWTQGTFSYEDGEEYGGDTNRIKTPKFQIEPSTEYTFSCNEEFGEIAWIFYQANGTTYIQGSGYSTTNNYGTIETPANAYYMKIRIGNRTFPKTYTTNYQQQFEKGSSSSPFEPYHDPIEYCKIGDYRDRFFKNVVGDIDYDNTLVDGDWYLKKNVEKINSYNGETITTDYISTTGGLDTGATVYYGLTTSTYIHITETDYPTLYTQLETINNNSTSYDGTTNITQTNADLPFNLSVDVLIKEEE